MLSNAFPIPNSRAMPNSEGVQIFVISRINAIET